jgi:hypothetical protein
MRRITSIVSASLLALPAPLALPTVAHAQAGPGGSGIVNFCRGDIPSHQPSVLGDCVGFVNTFISDSGGLIRFECDYVERFAPDLFYLAYDTVAECIVDKAEGIPDSPYNF